MVKGWESHPFFTIERVGGDEQRLRNRHLLLRHAYDAQTDGEDRACRNLAQLMGLFKEREFAAILPEQIGIFRICYAAAFPILNSFLSRRCSPSKYV